MRKTMHPVLKKEPPIPIVTFIDCTCICICTCTCCIPFRIQRYSVIPLSPNSGLIGWVPHCDTIHALIRDYRDKKKIMLNIEHRLMLQVSFEYETRYFL